MSVPVPSALTERVRDFIRDEVIPVEEQVAGVVHGNGHEADEALRARLQSAARAAGLLAPQLPTEWGGHGITALEQADVFEAAGYSLLGPLALNIAAPDEGNMHMLERVASPEQKEQWLRPLAAGSIRSAFAMTEPPPGTGSDPRALNTRAERVAGGWRISGEKWFITGARGADVVICMARTSGERGDAGGATMFLVPGDTAGMEIVRDMETIDAGFFGGHSLMRFDDCVVPDSAVLGEVDEGFRYAQVRLAPARLTHCMRWLGSCIRANEIATDYANRRMAFGKQLVDHEGVGFMLAQNRIDLKHTELMIDWCAEVLDTGALGTVESSMTKCHVGETLFQVADRCVQAMGGTGVSQDTIVEQVFREIRAFRIYDGPTEVHKWSLAKKIKREWREANEQG